MTEKYYKGAAPPYNPQKDKNIKNRKKQLRKKKPSSGGAPLYNPPKRKNKEAKCYWKYYIVSLTVYDVRLRKLKKTKDKNHRETTAYGVKLKTK